MSRVRLRLGKGTPAPPPASTLSLNANVWFPNWWIENPPFDNIAFSAPGNVALEKGGIVGTTTGNAIPDANRDAHGNVISVPGGETSISVVMQLPTTTAPRLISWQSKNGSGNGIAATPTVANATGVSVNLAARTIAYTPTNMLTDGAGPPILHYTPVSTSDYPIDIEDHLATGGSAGLNPDFASLVAAACSTKPIIRFMDWTTVNRNNSPIHQTADAGKTISSITFVGTTATVTTSTAHGLLGIGTASQSASVTVSGVTPATYNVTDAFVKVISPTQFQYTMGGTPSGNASVVGSYTVGDAGYQSTNLHYPSVGSEPGTQFNEPIYTAANRNKNAADAEWHDGVPVEVLTDTCARLDAHLWYNPPLNGDATLYPDVGAVCAAFSLATGNSVFLEGAPNEPWNPGFPGFHQLRNEGNLRGTLGDALGSCRLVTTTNVGLSGLAAIDGLTPIAGDRILVTGQTTASQNGVYVAAAGAWSRAADTLAFRAIWFVTSGLTLANSSWFISTQGAIVAGTTALTIARVTNAMRYAEKLVSIADAFISAFASAGVSSKLQVVAAWQNYGSTAAWDDMAAFVGPTDFAKIICLAVAPYYGDNSETALTAAGIGVGYTGSTAVLKTAMLADVDDTISHLAGHLTKAQSLGKKLISYEGGNTLNLSDVTYKKAWARSADAYDVELYFLQQLKTRIADVQSGGFALLSYNICAPLGNDNFSWGLVEANNQTRSKATTPKLQSHIDAKPLTAAA